MRRRPSSSGSSAPTAGRAGAARGGGAGPAGALGAVAARRGRVAGPAPLGSPPRRAPSCSRRSTLRGTLPRKRRGEERGARTGGAHVAGAMRRCAGRDGRVRAAERARARLRAIATRSSCTSMPTRWPALPRKRPRASSRTARPSPPRPRAGWRATTRSSALLERDGEDALGRAQDARDPAGAAARAAQSRPRLPLPGLHDDAACRRAPHRALGRRRGDRESGISSSCAGITTGCVHEGGYAVARSGDATRLPAPRRSPHPHLPRRAQLVGATIGESCAQAASRTTRASRSAAGSATTSAWRSTRCWPTRHRRWRSASDVSACGRASARRR